MVDYEILLLLDPELADEPQAEVVNYHLLLFSAPPETLDEISRVLKIDDNVMRHLATRRPQGGPSEPLPVAAPASHDAVIDDLAEEDED